MQKHVQLICLLQLQHWSLFVGHTSSWHSLGSKRRHMTDCTSFAVQAIALQSLCNQQTSVFSAISSKCETNCPGCCLTDFLTADKDNCNDACTTARLRRTQATGYTPLTVGLQSWLVFHTLPWGMLSHDVMAVGPSVGILTFVAVHRNAFILDPQL